MWISQTKYKYLKETVDELIKENELLKPLPIYNVFYKEDKEIELKRITGIYRGDNEWLNFYDKGGTTTAAFRTNCVVAFIRVP